MIDIVTHRARIGQYNYKAQTLQLGKSSPFSPCNPPKYLIFMALILVFSWSVAASSHSEIRMHKQGKYFSAANLREQYLIAHKIPFCLSTKELNRIAHTVNGNQRNRGKAINICFWNKGSSYFKNKQDDIREIIKNHNPMVLGLGEVQFKKQQELNEVQQPGFTLLAGMVIHMSPGHCKFIIAMCTISGNFKQK